MNYGILENTMLFSQKINSSRDFFLIKMYKRNMFKKGGNSLVLKKSGEIISTVEYKSSTTLMTSPISSPRFGLDSLTLSTKHINRYAQYNKINKNKLFYVENMDCINYQYTFDERCENVKM